MRPKQPRWTAQQIEVAEKLIANKATNEQCLEALGRSLKACAQRVRLGFAPEKIQHKTPAPVHVPPAVIAEAATRHLARPRDITGFVFGDPPKGYSALERRS